MSWQHISPGQLDWQSILPGVQRQSLLSYPFPVLAIRLSPAFTTEFAGFVLVQTGTAMLEDGTRLGCGDLVWRRHRLKIAAGESGCTWYQLDLPLNLQPAGAALHICRDAKPWQEFVDPVGRPTQPVQILLEGELSALRTRFAPTYTAGEHWHDYDTLYFIMAGDMRFGFEGQYYTGDIRQVKGGYSYGPEEPGPDGVEFVLFSCGGPVNLHWADLDASPHGALQPG
jgi:hypothetical protein